MITHPVYTDEYKKEFELAQNDINRILLFEQITEIEEFGEHNLSDVINELHDYLHDTYPDILTGA